MRILLIEDSRDPDRLVLRAYGHEERAPDPCYLELPEESVWVFPG